MPLPIDDEVQVTGIRIVVNERVAKCVAKAGGVRPRASTFNEITAH